MGDIDSADPFGRECGRYLKLSPELRDAGHVEITRDRLAARCTRCHKSLIYQKRIHPGLWEELLKSFVRKHRECKP